MDKNQDEEDELKCKYQETIKPSQIITAGGILCGVIVSLLEQTLIELFMG